MTKSPTETPEPPARDFLTSPWHEEQRKELVERIEEAAKKLQELKEKIP